MLYMAKVETSRVPMADLVQGQIISKSTEGIRAETSAEAERSHQTTKAEAERLRLEQVTQVTVEALDHATEHMHGILSNLRDNLLEIQAAPHSRIVRHPREKNTSYQSEYYTLIDMLELSWGDKIDFTEEEEAEVAKFDKDLEKERKRLTNNDRPTTLTRPRDIIRKDCKSIWVCLGGKAPHNGSTRPRDDIRVYSGSGEGSIFGAERVLWDDDSPELHRASAIYVRPELFVPDLVGAITSPEARVKEVHRFPTGMVVSNTSLEWNGLLGRDVPYVTWRNVDIPLGKPQHN